jgi:hypothetical protein
MSYFDGIFLVNDVYQYRLKEAWPVNGYADVIPSQIDPLFNLTKFATTGSFSTQLNQYGIDLTVLYPFNADTSTNKFNITVAGDAKAANFSPYTSGYYSASFDGTGDYLTVPGNSSFALGTGDFTLEVWLYANSISTGTFDRICATSDYNGSGFDWALNTSTSAFYLAGTSYNIGSITTKRWHHLVYTRSGSVIRGFLNGNLSSYTTGATQNISSTAQLNIGVGYSGTALNGYLVDLRIIKGSIPAGYQTSSTTTGTQIFTSPTTPLTAIANTSLLACQSNRFIDNSPNNFAITVNGNTAINPTNPFTVPSSVAVNNFYSTSFDGIGDYLQTPASSLTALIGTASLTTSSVFTIECWIYQTQRQTGAIPVLIGDMTPTYYTNYWSFGPNDVGLPALYWYDGNGKTATGNTTIPLNTWTHIAIVINASNIKMFVNGTLQSLTGTTTLTTTAGSHGYLAIGQYDNGDTDTGFYGTISNLRIVKSAVYTGAFTPPTAPLTAITNTSLLTCQSSTLVDNSTNNFPLTSGGQAQPIQQSPFTQTTSVSTTYLGSAYFDGTGDYLTTPVTASGPLDFGIGDWTVEAWVMYTGVSLTGAYRNFLTFCNDSGLPYIQFGTKTSTGYVFAEEGTQSAVSWTVAGTTVLTSNVWHHIAAVRNSDNIYLYLDGILQGSVAYSGTHQTLAKVQIGSLKYDGSIIQNWTGYISDVRVVKGTALYTTNFAVPQSPLTAVTNTSLLTLQTSQPHNNHTFLDKSNNKFLITRVGNATQGTFSPYNGSWSNYFDGATATRLSLASNPSFAFGTSAYTMEGWIYITTAPTYVSTLFDAGGTTNAISLGVTSAGAVAIGKYGIGNVLASNSGDVSLNQWVHIAAVRTSTSSNDTRLYVNGVLRATGTDNNNWTVTNTPTVGGINLSGYTTFGYISNLRVVKGTAVYTSAFTPPTAPLTITSGSSLLTSNSTSLLTCQSNRFIDISTNNFTITGNGGVAVSSESPFSKAYTHPVPTSYSGYFDGTGDYLVSPASSALALATNAADFTIECWVYNNGGAGSQYGRGICVYYPSGGYGTNRLMFRLIAGGDRINVYLLANSSAELGSSGTDGTATVTIGAWTHVALVRNAGVFYVYVNGVLDITVSSSSAASSIPFTTFNTIEVGRTQDGSSPDWNGYISNYRFVKGTAVYTSAFTPPTAPLTAITNTSLLTCQSPTFIDNSTNAFAITATGNPTPTTVNPFGSSQTLTDYTPAIYGGSAYFDGTGDYLLTSNMLSGEGNFTIEFWVYPESGASGKAICGAPSWEIYLSGFTVRFVYQGVADYNSSLSLIPNSWNHVVVERYSFVTGTSGGYKIFVNGVMYDTGSSVAGGGTALTVESGFLIGGSYYNSTPRTLWAGYISDLSIVKGTALYTSTFVPPVAPLTPNGNTSLLLNFTDAAIKDYTMRSNMETMADLKVSSANSKFGGTSLYFDGTGDYGNISPVSNTLILGTGDFTAEMWINPYSNITTTYPMTIGSEAAGRYNIFLVNGTLQVNLYGADTANLTFTGSRIPANIWSHIAVVRAAGNVKGYYNGNVLPNTQVNSSIIGNGPLRLGSDSSGSANFFGYMDDVRITANARYTANFIPAITYLPTR